MPLRNAVVDVFLKAFSEVQGDRSGPTGRLTDLKNAIVTHYDPGNGQPQRIKVQQRNAFETLTTAGHDSATGVTSTVAWANPELLSALGDQLLSIANAIPRVYDGTDWTHYAAERVVSNQLSESVFHTSQRTIMAPDSAWKSGVTCSVWVESLTNTDNIIYVGFKSDDGAWIRTPSIVYDPVSVNDGIYCYARVVADAAAPYFWVVYNRLTTGAHKFGFHLYDLNGQLIDFDLTSADQFWATEPGFWDIQAVDGGGANLVQPLHPAVDDMDGVSFALGFQSGGNITVTPSPVPDVHCRGPVAFMTNDLGDGFQYIATFGDSDGATTRLWGYQIDPLDPDPFEHEYNFNVNIPTTTIPDTMIGFTQTAIDPDAPG